MRLFLIILLFSITSYGQSVYYVTTTGSSGNNGLSEANAWSITHAFSNASAGDIIHIKKGNYNRSSPINITRSGSFGNPIRFQGYNVTPGDIVSVPHSSIDYGDTPASTNMPIIQNTGSPSTVDAFYINGDYLHFKNMVVKDFNIGFVANSNNGEFDNVGFFNLGPQTGDAYKGFGIRITGNNWLVKNSYGENVSAEAFLTRGNDNRFIDNEYHNDNAGAQTDYYMTVRGTSTSDGANNLFEGNKIYRYHNGTHAGHGYDVKTGNNNIFRNNYAFRTKLEVNFTNSFNNKFIRNTVEGSTARIHISNGAHDNLFDGNEIYDTGYQGIVGYMYNDGAAAAPIDCDCVGDNNVFVNNIIAGSVKAVQIQESSADIVGNTPVRGWIFKNNIFYEQTSLGGLRTNINLENFVFENNIWANGTANSAVNYLNGSSGTNVTFNKENYFNNSFAAPSGAGFTNITTHNPLFTNAGAKNFTLQSTSNLIDLGATTIYTKDILGNVRPQGAAFDIGPYEFQGSAPTDTTPPTITEVVESQITENSIQVEFRFDEGSTGRIEWGLTTAYGNFTTLETSYLTFHRQTITGLTPGTLYYYRILGGDAAGNPVMGAQRSATTLGIGTNPDPMPTLGIRDLRGKLLKLKKL